MSAQRHLQSGQTGTQNAQLKVGIGTLVVLVLASMTPLLAPSALSESDEETRPTPGLEQRWLQEGGCESGYVWWDIPTEEEDDNDDDDDWHGLHWSHYSADQLDWAYACTQSAATLRICEVGDVTITATALVAATPCTASALNEQDKLAARILWTYEEDSKKRDRWYFWIWADLPPAYDHLEPWGQQQIEDQRGHKDTGTGRLLSSTVGAASIPITGIAGNNEVTGELVRKNWIGISNWATVSRDIDWADGTYKGTALP
jgi:hypothetical protein